MTWGARLLAAWLLAALAGHAACATRVIDQAWLVVQRTSHAEPARQITLPLHWDIDYEGLSGEAELTLNLPVTREALSAGVLQAAFISRLGVAYEIALNGEIVSRAGSLNERDRFYAKHPVSFLLPPHLLREGDNALRVRLRADAGYRAGMAPLIVGPVAEVMPLARRAAFWRVALPLAASVLSLLVGLFCLLLWLQQRDPLYAWAGVGELLWAVTVVDTVLETVPLPWPYWGLALLLLRAAWAWSLYAIAEQVFGRPAVVERRLMLFVQFSAPVFLVAIALMHSMLPLLVWYALNFALWGWVIFRLGMLLNAGMALDRLLVWVGVTAVVVASARDAVAARLDASLYAESAWAKYMAVLVGSAVMIIVSMRFRQARQQVLQLNASLASRVAQKEGELRLSLERMATLERSRAVLAERERILRDMHDGVGANLATAVRQLEGGQARADEVAKSLRESMTHLKLAIDAMNLPPGDVNALLASLRYRLQPRIESAGLAVRWDVDVLPVWPGGNDEQMRRLQFLLLEAVSNVLQHAAANTLTMGAHLRGGHIELSVRDDGRGISEAAAGSGLRSMRERARSLGAILQVEPGQPGTCVRIELPLS